MMSKNASTAEEDASHNEVVLTKNKQVILRRSDLTPCTPRKIPLKFGGTITVVPAVIGKEELEQVRDEVKTSNLFRTYTIQSEKEPRCHFLLHPEVTEEESAIARPGYRYGGITMKAQPLQKLAKVATLAGRMKQMAEEHFPKMVEEHYQNDGSKEAFWNLGVDVVYYRSGTDYIGMHKDDAQGEELVCTAIVDCPIQRRILVKSNDGSEILTLFLRPGDIYVMDAEMQEHYKHGVPKVTSQQAPFSSRLAIVFRRGEQRTYLKDSGESLYDLSPRDTKTHYIFGRIEGIEEGMCYDWKELKSSSAHKNIQAGVDGNRTQGCSSINVAQSPTDDSLFQFIYKAKLEHGKYRLDTSAKKRLPVRVFRSSKAGDCFSPPQLSTKATYRYDGLYDVQAAGKAENSDFYNFVMTRVEKGDSVYENGHEIMEFVLEGVRKGTVQTTASVKLGIQNTASASVPSASFEESHQLKSSDVGTRTVRNLLSNESERLIDFWSSDVETRKERKRRTEAERLVDALSPETKTCPRKPKRRAKQFDNSRIVVMA